MAGSESVAFFVSGSRSLGRAEASSQTKTTSCIKSCFQFHEGAWTIVHQHPTARLDQTSKQKLNTTFCSRDTAHVIMARTVARILSKKFHQDRRLTLKLWKRTICNMIANSRNLHPVYAQRTQLRSMILIQSEDKAPDTVANEEALDTTTFRVDLGVCLREYYQLRGATNEEATFIINEIGTDTLKRYNSAWHMFGTFLLQDAALAPLLKVERFGQIPLMTVAVQLLKFSRTHSLSAGRMAYSAVCLFPCSSQLRFGGMLRNLKRDWFVSVPHYHRFYDVRRLIQVMHQQPVETEAQLRLQAILSLRFFALFRGVDLARSRRDIQRAAQPWFISAKRKGRRYYARYPIHNVTPPSIDLQRCLARYLEATGDYEGSEIFVSLRKPRKPLSSDTINGLTTRWLRKHLLELGELETDSFSAHST